MAPGRAGGPPGQQTAVPVDAVLPATVLVDRALVAGLVAARVRHGTAIARAARGVGPAAVVHRHTALRGPRAVRQALLHLARSTPRRLHRSWDAAAVGACRPLPPLATGVARTTHRSLAAVAARLGLDDSRRADARAHAVGEAAPLAVGSARARLRSARRSARLAVGCSRRAIPLPGACAVVGPLAVSAARTSLRAAVAARL